MKIGILTQPLRYNYGGILQNYALQKVLIDMGNDVITIDQKEQIYLKYHFVRVLSAIKTLLFKLLGRGQNRKYPETRWSEAKKGRSIQVFTDSRVHHTPTIKSSRKIKRYIKSEGFAAIVVGSDQVWRPRFNQDILLNFLDGLEDVSLKRIAYAVSFGVDEWEFNKQQTEEAKRLINLFDFVGVREASGILLCKEYLKYENAQLVLDPTLLLERIDYEKLIETKYNNNDNDKYLLTYILNKTTLSNKTIENVAKTKGLSVKSVAHGTGVYPSIETWLYGFMNASYVVCDSFHAVAFSIIFNKDFVVLGNKGRGMTRITNILSIFDLSDRLVTDINQTLPSSHIDWDAVNNTRKSLNNHSRCMLNKALS